MLPLCVGVKESGAVERIRTQVAIVGAARRPGAGVLEHPTVQLLCDSGVGDGLLAEGLQHRGISLRFDGADHHLDFVALTSVYRTGRERHVRF
jgi:hypothetical protein